MFVGWVAIFPQNAFSQGHAEVGANVLSHTGPIKSCVPSDRLHKFAGDNLESFVTQLHFHISVVRAQQARIRTSECVPPTTLNKPARFAAGWLHLKYSLAGD
jgi:hypothetical protein